MTQYLLYALGILALIAGLEGYDIHRLNADVAQYKADSDAAKNKQKADAKDSAKLIADKDTQHETDLKNIADFYTHYLAGLPKPGVHPAGQSVQVSAQVCKQSDPGRAISAALDAEDAAIDAAVAEYQKSDAGDSESGAVAQSERNTCSSWATGEQQINK